MKPHMLEHLVVRPTLKLMSRHDPRLYTEPAVTLMMGTIAQESDGGMFNMQIGLPPGQGAVGICQVEYATEYDIRNRYIPRHEILMELLDEIAGEYKGVEALEDEFYQAQLESNQKYCVFIARLKYWMKPDPMPEDNLAALGQYWDTHYNANPDHGTVTEFVESYKQFVNPNRSL